MQISQYMTKLGQQLDTLTLKDAEYCKKQLQHISKKSDTQEQKIKLVALDEKITYLKQKIRLRAEQLPALSYPEDLPVTHKKTAIKKALVQHQVIIVAGETGSGKTTQLPKICLEFGRGIKGMIGHTQPRRLAARSVATRLAQELHTEIGKTVGFKVRFRDRVSEATLIKVMTDGILLAEIQQDRLLRQYDTIIIDEAHERSLNIDFLLGYLKQILPKRPDLKLIITSATIDLVHFSTHFNHAPIVEISGRTYPVEVRYRPPIEYKNEDQLQVICQAIDELYQEPMGDILIFMAGEKEIKDTAEALSKLGLPHTDILPLYARLSASEQNRIFQPHTGRRIILSTNVGETSLTVPGIRYVIDPGLARISRYSYRTKVQRLPIEPISQSSANQRKGRCGRVAAGICIRLYSEEDFLSRPLYTDPEIKRTNLAAVILQMIALKLGKIEHFPFMQPPDKRHIQDGLRLLQELGALQSQPSYTLQLTDIGKQLAQLPLDPRLARMIIAGKENGALHEVMIITAALSIQDPRERPLDKQQAADEKHRYFHDKQSDFLSFINLWHYLQEQQKQLTSSQFAKLCRQQYLNYLRIREWQDIYLQIRQTVKELKFTINSQPADYKSVHCSLLSGLLSHIGFKHSEKQHYLGTRNSQFNLYPNSVLFKKNPKWCVVSELVETTKLWGRIAATIDVEWIESLATHLVKYSYSEPHWSRKQGAVIAKEKVTLYELPIITNRQVNYGRIDAVLSRELFIRHALIEGDWQSNYLFFKKNRKLLLEVEELEHKSRRRDIIVDEKVLFDFYDSKLPANIVSTRHFDRWWQKCKLQQPDLLNFNKKLLINKHVKQISIEDYPDYWQQGHLRFKLSYQFEPGQEADGVTVHIPLNLLNQVEDNNFDWQVPGLRLQLIVALIKSLPKSIRRSLVPAPNYAEAFLSRIPPFSQPLLPALEQTFRKITGVIIERTDWRLDQLDKYLLFTFRIENQQGEKIAEGNSLTKLKTQLQDQVIEQLTQTVDDNFEQNHLYDWSFDELPQFYEKQQGRYTIKAYPTLIDEQDHVSIKLLDSSQKQAEQMQQGLRRLLLLTIPTPIKYLHEKLPNKAKLGLYFTPFGSVLSLIDDCIACAVDELITELGGIVWNEPQFRALQNKVKIALNPMVVVIAEQVEKILSLSYQLNKRLKGRLDIAVALSMADIKAQINHLIYPGFVTKTGYKRLTDISRYLHAIDKRLDKLHTDPQRDRINMLKIEHVQQAYYKLVNKLPVHNPLTEEIKQVKWMIEELRVNLFAQQLGTPYPISDKRIIQYMENITM